MTHTRHTPHPQPDLFHPWQPEPAPTAPRGWIAVASAEHVRIGQAGGFMQVCHGKAAPLRRLAAGDWVAYYSPAQQFRRGLAGRGGAPAADRLMAFTAIGRVRPGPVYPHRMAPDFEPHRRDVDWLPGSHDAPIHPLLPQLLFTRGQPNWAAALRFGLVAVALADIACIARAMGVAEGAAPAAC